MSAESQFRPEVPDRALGRLFSRRRRTDRRHLAFHQVKGDERATVRGTCSISETPANLRIVDINGASAIVTGGASGIGAASARALAAKGVKVVVADMNAEKGEEIAKEIDGVFVSIDVTDSEQIKAAIAKAEEIGTFRIPVNSAGIGWAQRTIGKDGNFDSAHNLDFFKKVINVNVFGTFDFVRLGATAISRTEPSPTASAARSSTSRASQASRVRSGRCRTQRPRVPSTV